MATDWDKVAGISSITGTVQGMIGSYYAASTEKYKYKSILFKKVNVLIV